MRSPSAVPLSAALLLIVALVVPGAAAAQIAGVPVTLEARGAGALAAGDFASSRPGLGAGAGAGFAAGARVGVVEAVEVYGLYRYGRFACDGCEAAGLDENATEAGFEAGARVALPFGSDRLASWASGGVLVAHELALAGGGGERVSDPSLGFAAAAGVDLPLGEGRWTVSPGLHYRRYSSSFDFDLALDDPFGAERSLTRDLVVSHVSLEVGLSYRF